MTGRMFLPVLFLAWSLPALADPVVIQGPVAYNGHLYVLLSMDTWTASEAAAVLLGGHLVTINDAAENSFVINAFTNNATLDRNLWIGLNDLAVEGTFVWASGEPVTFTNWNASEPNNLGNEDFVYIVSPTQVGSGRWNDLHDLADCCFGVVEGVPEPGTLLLLGTGLLGVAGYGRKKLSIKA